MAEKGTESQGSSDATTGANAPGRPRGDRTTGRIPWNQFKQCNITNGLLRSMPSYQSFNGDYPSGESNDLSITVRPRIKDPFIPEGGGDNLTSQFSGEGMIVGAHYWPRTGYWYFAVKAIANSATPFDDALNIEFWRTDGQDPTGAVTLMATTVAPQTGYFASYTEFFNATTSTHYLLVSTGAELWYIDTANAITQVTDPNLPVHEPQICTLDGYVFVAKQGTAEIYNSFVDDFTAWQETTFIMAETEGGDVKGVYSFKNYVVALKEYTIEFFRNAAIPDPNSPLQRVPELRKEVGFFGGIGIKSDNDSMYFWGASQTNRNRVSFRRLSLEGGGAGKVEELPVPWFSQKAIPSTTPPDFIVNLFHDALGFAYLSYQTLQSYNGVDSDDTGVSALNVFDLTHQRWFRWAHFNDPASDDTTSLSYPTHWQLPWHSGGYWFPLHFYEDSTGGRAVATKLQEVGDPAVVTTPLAIGAISAQLYNTLPWESHWAATAQLYGTKPICLQIDARPFATGGSETRFLYSCSFLDYGRYYAGNLPGEGGGAVTHTAIPCRFTVTSLRLDHPVVQAEHIYDRPDYVRPDDTGGYTKEARFYRLGMAWDFHLSIRLYTRVCDEGGIVTVYQPIFHGLDVVWGQGLK